MSTVADSINDHRFAQALVMLRDATKQCNEEHGADWDIIIDALCAMLVLIIWEDESYVSDDGRLTHRIVGCVEDLIMLKKRGGLHTALRNLQ